MKWCRAKCNFSMKLWTRQLDSWAVTAYDFRLIGSRMYLLRQKDAAYVIDPYEEPCLLADLPGVEKLTVLLTHEHFDHISGVNWLRQQRDVTVVAGKACAEDICQEDNSTRLFPLLFFADREKYRQVLQHYTFPYLCRADIRFSGSRKLEAANITLWETPGHSPGSICILLDEKFLFSGDTLLGNGQELRSPRADKALFLQTLQHLRSLSDAPETVTVFPGHGDPVDLKTMLERVEASL